MTKGEEEVRAILNHSTMKETILVLASEPVIRKSICKTLRSVGYFVMSAGDLGRAMDLLKECRPALFLVRHFTDGVPGHEAAMYVRGTLPGIPVLIFGGTLDDPDIEDRAIVHRFEVFPPPIKPSQLLNKVEEMLIGSHLREKANSG